MYSYKFPRPSVTVDVVLFRWNENIKDLECLLIERANDPHKGSWALPGGFLDMEETPATAAARELQEETGIKDIKVHEYKVFGDPTRDPRGRVLSIAHYAFLPINSEQQAKAADDAAKTQWFAIQKLPELAFDHDSVIAEALQAIVNDSQSAMPFAPIIPSDFSFETFKIMVQAIFRAETPSDALIKTALTQVSEQTSPNNYSLLHSLENWRLLRK